ncbi:TPR-like protein [Paxillus ammoniavirescens]|nr:TPR-like protein [Paxillus ammoniavirescens]
MSLSMLVGGADCGPSNPLQSLTKKFDHDRGIQQDFVGTSRAGSSREVFRSQHAPAPELHQDAARFFGAGPSPAPQMAVPQSFNLSSFHDALPTASSVPVQSPQLQSVPSAAWAADFLTQQQQRPQAQAVQVKNVEMQQDRIQSPPSSIGGMQSGGLPWNPAYSGYRMGSMSGMMPAMTVSVQRPSMQTDQISWDKEFQSQEFLLSTSAPVVAEAPPQEQHHQQRPDAPVDDMARIAAQVIDSVKHEQNPKFQKSEFMNLMRQLRDGEVKVEDDKIVPKELFTGSADVKGKGRAVEMPLVPVMQDAAGPSHMDQPVLHSYQGSQELNEAYLHQARDPHEAYFHQENADFTEYWQSHYAGPPAHTADKGQESSWYQMQRDWEAFEATTTGIQPVANYQFQTDNPYLVGDSSRTHHHSLHIAQAQLVSESVLELEAAVQRDPTNAAAWFELGVKQQENEREAKAIQALQRSIDLDPSHLPAWLALSVSYTNDNNRMGTYNAVKEWVLQNPKYQDIVSQTSLGSDSPGDFAGLVDVLINIARSADQKGGVDADVQVALAVLLNTTEDYARAVDCFLTALAVRPEDWLLYNRVGATMANKGRAEEALPYYYRALELNPAYIRARFNLGISCINLRRYEEAASHILDALVLQDSDGVADETGMNDKRGVTSSTLWDSLKTTCLHLQRVDLASLCDSRDLDGFRDAFHLQS